MSVTGLICLEYMGSIPSFHTMAHAITLFFPSFLSTRSIGGSIDDNTTTYSVLGDSQFNGDESFSKTTALPSSAMIYNPSFDSSLSFLGICRTRETLRTGRRRCENDKGSTKRDLGSH